MRRALALSVPLVLLLAGAAAAKPAAQGRDANAPVFLGFVDPDLSLPGLVQDAQVHFNPKELSVDKSVPWGHRNLGSGDAPPLAFTNGEPYRLNLTLLFDGYETQTDVGPYAAKLQKFVAVEGDKRPPLVTVVWSAGPEFTCVLESFSLRFTLFLDDGTPVRAVLDAAFKDFVPAANETHGSPRH